MESDKRDDENERNERSSMLSNRRRQAERLKKKAERIEKRLTGNAPKIGKQGREIKSDITGNDSAKMVTSHGIIRGYNGQVLVDSKKRVIVHAEAFGMVDGARENMEAIGHSDEDYFARKTLVADTNYHSPTNLNKCEDQPIDAYIPDKDFRKRDPRFATQERHRPKKEKRFTLEDFQYNEAADRYVCPDGRVLTLQSRRVVIDGVIYGRYVADTKYCKGCQLKLRSISRKNAKRRFLNVPVGSVAGNLIKLKK